MKRLFFFLLVFAAAICFSNKSFAAEHPEHGVAPGKSIKEHPGAEHHGETAMLSREEVVNGIKGHINNTATANAGYFPIHDDKENKDLKLELVRIHEDKVSYIKKDDAYFACSDFLADDGKTAYDVDFWMKKTAEGTLEVYKTLIHKKDGNPRFTYSQDEIAPVK